MDADDVIDIDDPKYRTTPLQQVLASCTGAVVTSLFVTPLDVVKIRLQAQSKNMTSKCFLYCNGLMDHICDCSGETNSWSRMNKQMHFNGTMDAIYKISKVEGVSSLWSGLSPTLVLAIPATVVYFVTYEQLRLKLKDNYNKDRPEGTACTQPIWIPLIAGGTARIFSVSLVSPLELIRTKMQSTKLTYYEIGEALKILVQQSGIRGLWKGVVATLMRDVPFSAIYWTGYENIKCFLNNGVPSFWNSFIAGAISGGLAAAVTVPFDVVKTHQQIEIGTRVIANQKQGPPVSTLSLVHKLYLTHGLKGLFAGLTPRLIKVAPACAIMIATFEHSKVVFNRYNVEKYHESQMSSSAPARIDKAPATIDINVPNVTKQSSELL